MLDSAGTLLLACWMKVLLLLCLLPGSVCQEGGGCLRTADLLSCSGLGLDHVPAGLPVSVLSLDLSHNRLSRLRRGSLQGLSQLEVLNLAHNQLVEIQPGALGNASAPRLRHLDLSSNRLQALQQHFLSELPGLEELLLFNNRVVQVEGGALAAATRLRQLYLSHNRLRDFPFLRLRRQPALSLLDLSSNRLSSLPLRDVSALPPPTQQGLRLHNNPLRGGCALLQLFAAWKRRGFASVRDFLQEHVCLLHGVHGAAVRFLQQRRYLDRCAASGLAAQAQRDSSVAVQAGQALLLRCAALGGANISVVWVSPRQEGVVPPGDDGGGLKVHANGSLEIVAARVEDAGLYWCMALDPLQWRNHTWEVNVTVLAHGRHQQPFSTALTTLLGCVVSLLLVLAYLYLTPCRCPAPPATQGCTPTSILSPGPAAAGGAGHKVSSSKRVVFLEPIREQQNGRLAATEEQPRPQRAEHANAFTFTPILSP